MNKAQRDIFRKKGVLEHAEWFAAQEWETQMPLPLEEVRDRLNIEPPDFYEETKRRFPEETAHPHDADRIAAE